ncbi:hypothetical protein A3D62_03040 [Candidatus Kaiserbacteria bacterium RIFCSPHIGHO2_02_FULL_49_11]|uniref:Uncharacterized protein n=1 Tax=Candidatus Kaiserbacteria bacterium RIFCSPHIGHO2_02_FULL_49_11 TaxID=1798489 RepID=A0A1F6D0M1_9BACT|nr:MAG: hypothetical protein A3D62_03040 [Candidatus Kaiserbacteria bacterium RIFCSPHIGHO2_02_FULL_49_11]
MRDDKDKAVGLRKLGKSFNQIQEELGIPKSTLSGWFKDKGWSQEVTKRSARDARFKHVIHIQNMNRIRGEKLRALYEKAKDEAATEFDKYKHNPLFISAITAYWGEGDKGSKYLIRITNTDPRMLAIFRKFLINICAFPDDKIKAAMFIYPDLDEETCYKYWSRKTGIKKFTKTMVLPSRHKTRRLPYGVCTLVISNRYLKEKMIVWLNLLPSLLLDKVVQSKKRI